MAARAGAAHAAGAEALGERALHHLGTLVEHRAELDDGALVLPCSMNRRLTLRAHDLRKETTGAGRRTDGRRRLARPPVRAAPQPCAGMSSFRASCRRGS